MSNQKKKVGLNTVISWGASVVIIGLMFKILHWPFGELFIAVGLAFLITIIMASKKPVGKFGLILDSLGLGFSVVAAVDVSLRNHAPVYAAIVLGVLSGVLGGLTRDVLCQVPPVLLHRETSGTVSVLGACVYVALYKSGYDSLIAGISGGVLIVLLRLASIKFKINLPKVG